MAEPVEQIPAATGGDENSSSLLMSIINQIIYSPLNMGLVVIIGFLVYKILRDRFDENLGGSPRPEEEPKLPKLRQDFTVEELRKFDGNQPDGRVLVAVNGMIYDVTKGKRFYGPGGPYSTFAGRDASRNLATFSVVTDDKYEYDDLSDLSAMEMDSIREWEMQFKEKYDFVGKLLRPGEQPTNYEDEEEDTATDIKANDNQEEEKDESADSEGVRKRASAAINEDVK